MPDDRNASARCLCEQTLESAVRELSQRDRMLDAIVHSCGPPPLWGRDADFSTLIRIILEQQVSLASAKAAFNRLLSSVDSLAPERFLLLDDETLKSIGFSRQKSGYGRNLARAIVEGDLELDALQGMDDEQVRRKLTAIKGIGTWTADIFLLMALRRPDIWPMGDLALAIAIQHLTERDNRPTQEEIDRLSELWKPWRAVAARLLWHYYLSRIARVSG
ncbi:MAG: DNA-3-methyladenine glycosylase 2 family protein [Desulfuromonadales bacterium]|nr:DNA-3-methyladenine glycosylase 2 family protein [Desulfuromonadales bacterium]